jgi:hypothetical protein
MILLNIFVAILMDGYAEATEEGNVCVCVRARSSTFVSSDAWMVK